MHDFTLFCMISTLHGRSAPPPPEAGISALGGERTRQAWAPQFGGAAQRASARSASPRMYNKHTFRGPQISGPANRWGLCISRGTLAHRATQHPSQPASGHATPAGASCGWQITVSMGLAFATRSGKKNACVFSSAFSHTLMQRIIPNPGFPKPSKSFSECAKWLLKTYEPW